MQQTPEFKLKIKRILSVSKPYRTLLMYAIILALLILLVVVVKT